MTELSDDELRDALVVGFLSVSEFLAECCRRARQTRPVGQPVAAP